MRPLRILLIGLVSLIPSCVGVAAWSQGQEEPQAHDLSEGKHVNLKVLPEDISIPRLGALMRGYKRDLGVQCSYCHVENHDTGQFDYASDENPKKATARIMIAMLEDINEKHLAQLGDDVRYSTPVTCGTCHQGRTNPPQWEAKP